MINYVIGDATLPIGDGPKIIAHVCNNQGAWGAGFVLALSRRWTAPEYSYREWARKSTPLPLGTVQIVRVEEDILVANMIAMKGVGAGTLRYDALVDCLGSVSIRAVPVGASIHMPRIGCGLAGGSWDKVEPIVRRELNGLNVTVYDLPEGG